MLNINIDFDIRQGGAIGPSMLLLDTFGLREDALGVRQPCVAL